MATTGSSFSTVKGDGVAEALTDNALVDLVVAIIARPAPTTGATTFIHDVEQFFSQDPALRWQVAIAHTDASRLGIASFRNALSANTRLEEVPYTLQPSDALAIPFHGTPGRARAVHAILKAAHASGARGCLVLDPHSAFPAQWLGHLAQPLLAGTADYIAPVYHRHPFAGALIHGVLYPTFRALYGSRLRYPISADLACSRSFMEAVLPEPIWETGAGQTGIDLWLSASAVADGFRVAQATMGPRVDEPASVDVSTAVSQVVGTLFTDMESRATTWQRIRESRPLPQFGPPLAPADRPEMDVARLADSFRLGLRELTDVWAEVLPPLAILQWRRLAASSLDTFRVDDALWARTVYDFAVGHRQRVIAREHLLPAFTPLYLGWLASFVLEVQRTPIEPAEERIERLCLAFESEKPYLISQWRWPERFKPVKRRR